MVQVGLVHHHYAGVAQGHAVNEVVIGVVAQLVKGDIELSGIEESRIAVEYSEVRDGIQLPYQRRGVIGDAAARGRQGREESDSQASRRRL
jgi:hypothetical protein